MIAIIIIIIHHRHRHHPQVLLATKLWRNDLVGLYTGVACGYGLLCILFQVIVVTSDWEYWANEAQKRSELGNSKAKTANIQDDDTAPLVEKD